MTQQEPPDHYNYTWVSFDTEAVNFYISAFKFYQTILEADLKAFSSDPDLNEVLPLEIIKTLPVSLEIERAKRGVSWLTDELEKHSDRSWGVDLSISHGTVRLIKSVCSLYMSHLRSRRDSISTKPRIATQALSSVDQRLAKVEEFFSTGVFQAATLVPLMASDQAIVPSSRIVEETIRATVEPRVSPTPIILSSIQILNSTLRSRCLDLFDTFNQQSQPERLDTVVSEATRILEDSLRAISMAPLSTSGLDLATYAFTGSNPRLKVSHIEAEQQAANQLFRGAFGFLRNASHHRLLGELKPERVLQIVAFIDYLIHIAETAEHSPETKE